MVAREHDVPGRVVEAVAAARDVDPIELRPLYEFVDPDALEAFVGSAADGGRPAHASVRFDYDGETVVVRGDGSVQVGDAIGVLDRQRSR